MSLLLNSPRVLEALSKGNIRKANELMGSVYTIRAVVVHGNHRGRSLGFPTANLDLQENNTFFLAHGVYAVKTEFEDLVYNGMANAGVRPTIDGKTFVIEVHLFDFTGTLYDKHLTVSFIDRIRDEKKFNTIEELVAQIQRDKKRALKLLS